MSATKATINDVASLAQVSIKTVSRVVNGEPNVSEATTEKVQAAIQQVNYRPNQAARNLASARSHLIALIYDDPEAYEMPSPGYIISLQAGALAACRAANHELLIHPCNFRRSSTAKELLLLIEKARPDGVVIAAPISNMQPLVDSIKSSGVPSVRLSPGNSSSSEFTVATNDRSICAEMTAYLASLGHKRIAFIQGDAQHAAVNQRFLGYKDGLATAGLPLKHDFIAQGDNSIGSGERCGEALLSLSERPTAIFAANDDMAAGVLRVAHQLKLSIPKELSVAGFDDRPLAQQIYPALTSIRQPVSDMAELATAHLINSATPKETGLHLIPSRIILRESTGKAPSSH